MGPITPIQRRRVTGVDRKKVGKDKGSSASVSQSVLNFLAFGLTEGAESLAENWTPRSKVNEYVIVSKEMFSSLKLGHDNKFKNDSVMLSMKVNGKQKQIELVQLGRNVMMTLDESTIIIKNITLTEIYAKMRNDIIRHADIYGKDLQLTAITSPAPRLTT